MIDFLFCRRDAESSKAVEQVLTTKGQQQKELLGSLLEDEKYQREAFAALFMRQDTRHKELCSQVEQIQSELASLTMVEMTKKDLKVRFFCSLSVSCSFFTRQYFLSFFRENVQVEFKRDVMAEKLLLRC